MGDHRINSSTKKLYRKTFRDRTWEKKTFPCKEQETLPPVGGRSCRGIDVDVTTGQPYETERLEDHAQHTRSGR